MKVLVTAFDPFGGEELNASWEVLKQLPEEIGGCRIIKRQLPTIFRKSFEALKESIDSYNPEIVICLGQAAGRRGITVERVAINIDDARIPDNAGNMPIDSSIEKNGEAAYFSTLPIKAMVEEMKKRGIEASVSNTAGTFVCNHLMYLLLYHAKGNKKYRGGFIHIPCIEEQGRAQELPFMELNKIVEGLTVAIEVAGKISRDIRVGGGSLH